MKLRPPKRLPADRYHIPGSPGGTASEFLILETRQTEDGRRVLYFPFVSVSDIHWGTKYSKAKRLSHFFEQTVCDHLMLVGDIIDGEALVEKEASKIGPWHRQGIAHVIRKAEQGTKVIEITGNHDEELRGRKIRHTGTDGQERVLDYRKMSGKSVYGIAVEDSYIYTDPKGRRFFAVHGDQFDGVMFKTTADKKKWYRRGDTILHALYDFDLYLRKLPGLENFSIAATAKSALKTTINLFWNITRTVANRIDRSQYDGVLYGHSHMPAFKKTPGGKLIVNDGSCIEHVQAAVHDRNGNWALIEWHKTRLDVLMENGRRYSVPMSELGLTPASERMIEDGATRKADRLLRIVYRLWPSQERQRALAEIREKQGEAVQLGRALETLPTESLRESFREAEENLVRLKDGYLKNPIPRHGVSAMVPVWKPT